MAQGEVEVKFSAKGAEALRAQIEAVKKTLGDLSRGNGGNGADFSKITQQLKAANVEAKKLEATLNRASKQKVNVGRGGGAIVYTGGGSTAVGGAGTGGVGIVGGNGVGGTLGDKLDRKLENFVGKIDEVGWQFSRLMRVVGRITMILAAAEIGMQIGGRVGYAMLDEKNRPSTFNPWRDARATFLNTGTLKAFSRAFEESMVNPDVSFFQRFGELATELSPMVQRLKAFRAALDEQTQTARETAKSTALVSDAMRKLADITDKYAKKRDLISIDRMKGAGTTRVGNAMQDLSIDIAEATEKLEPERARAAEILAAAIRKRKELAKNKPTYRDVDIGVDDEGMVAKEYLSKLAEWEKALLDANKEIKNAQHEFDNVGATVDHLNAKMKALDERYQEELAREKKEITKEWQSLEKRRDEAIYGKRDKSIEELTDELKKLDDAVAENSNEIGMLNSKTEGGWDFEALREKMNELAEQVGELEAIKAEIETKQAKLEAAERERKEREGFKLGSDLPGASDSLARVGGYLGGNVFNMQTMSIQREIAKNTAETARAVKGIKPAQTVFN